MEDKIVSVETAELAMKCGFDIETDKGYYKHGSENDFVKLLLWVNIEDGKPEFGYAPTQSLLQKWLREVKEENITPPLFFSCQGYACDIMGFENTKYFKTYEDALENELYECLQRVSETVA